MLKSVDLFSGIGGISFALQSITRPIVYCEKNEYSKNVLLSNIRRGYLYSAPICSDVRQITSKWLQDNIVSSPDIIVAGFPCVGFSIAGLRNGYDNPETALFYEIVRIIDLFSSIQSNQEQPALFIENVPQIIHKGFREIIKEMCMKRCYNLHWCTLRSSDIGAPQKRKRWYCLAVPYSFKNLPMILDRLNKIMMNQKPYPWKSSEPQRATLNFVHHASKRISVLGDSVVPDAVKFAFHHLVTTASGKGLHQFSTTKKLSGIKLNTSGSIFTSNNNKRQFYLAEHDDPRPSKSIDYSIVLDPETYKQRNTHNIHKAILRGELVYTPMTKTHWSTLSRTDGSSGVCNVLTKRSSRKLRTMVRFERRTPNHLRKGTMSPQFAEWLMGFPLNWTIVN